MTDDNVLDTPNHKLNNGGLVKSPYCTRNDAGKLRSKDQDEVDDTIPPHHESQRTRAQMFSPTKYSIPYG